MKNRTRRRLAALVVAIVLLAAPARPEDAPALEPGMRVRLTAAESGHFAGTVTGTLVRITDRNLTLVDSERGATLELQRDSITRLEVSPGPRRHGRLGLLIGTAVGIPFGLAVANDAANDPVLGCGTSYTGYQKCTTGDKVIFTVVGAAMLGGAGAWIGHKIHSEHWSRVPLDHVKVMVQPERSGGRVNLTLAF